MPVQKIDVDISSGALLPSELSPDVAAAVAQNRIDTQEKISEGDREAEVRKKVETKAAQFRVAAQQTTVNRQQLRHDDELLQRTQQILGGAAGPEAAQTLSAWGNNTKLQAKLTEAQKKHFIEEMVKNPRKATEAGNAVDRLMKQPGFQQAVTSTEQMSTLQAGLLENPKAEVPTADLLKSRFMQSPKADPATKSQFLRFGMQQAAKNQLDVVKPAGDMLGTLAGHRMPATTQRAAMAMVQRAPGDKGAMANVDSFAQHAKQTLPSFARGKATELLAKANGKPLVKEGFQTLAGNNRFKAQTPANKGRFFSTIGSGKPSEYRALTDHALAALRSKDFPNRAPQVGRFLTKMATQVTKGGAASVDTKALLKEAKKSAVPTPPTLVSTAGLDEEEAAHVRSRNRGQVLHYYNQLKRSYEQSAKTIKNAHFFEDVTLLSLREPGKVETEGLEPDLASLCETLHNGTCGVYTATVEQQKRRMRETRNRRITPLARRSREAARRSSGKPTRYCQPNLGGRSAASQVFAQATGTDGPQQQPPPGRGLGSLRAGASFVGRGGSGGDSLGATGTLDTAVAAAMSQLGSGPLTADRATHMARAIAQQVASQVAQQVTKQLLSFAGPSGAPPAGSLGAAADVPSERRQTVGSDGWGVPRVFERDLGGGGPAVAHTKLSSSPDAPPPVDERYTGKILVKDTSSVRPLPEIMTSPASWNELDKGEQILLRNLGWNGQSWATRNAKTAKWPPEMVTAYADLSPAKKQAVRDLGYSANDWDSKVLALKMGQNA